MSETQDVAVLERVEGPDGKSIVRRRRWLHRSVTLLLVALLGATVLDGLDVVEVVGPDEQRARTSAAGYELEVEYPSTTRPALATVFRIAVRRAEGFDEPIHIGVSRRYLESFDLNGLLPATAGETAVGSWIVWEFDPPPGDELVITYEARLEPGVQQARPGEVAVFEDDEPVARVRFTTQVRP